MGASGSGVRPNVVGAGSDGIEMSNFSSSSSGSSTSNSFSIDPSMGTLEVIPEDDQIEVVIDGDPELLEAVAGANSNIGADVEELFEEADGSHERPINFGMHPAVRNARRFLHTFAHSVTLGAMRDDAVGISSASRAYLLLGGHAVVILMAWSRLYDYMAAPAGPVQAVGVVCLAANLLQLAEVQPFAVVLGAFILHQLLVGIAAYFGGFHFEGKPSQFGALQEATSSVVADIVFWTLGIALAASEFLWRPTLDYLDYMSTFDWLVVFAFSYDAIVVLWLLPWFWSLDLDGKMAEVFGPPPQDDPMQHIQQEIPGVESLSSTQEWKVSQAWLAFVFLGVPILAATCLAYYWMYRHYRSLFNMLITCLLVLFVIQFVLTLANYDDASTVSMQICLGMLLIVMEKELFKAHFGDETIWKYLTGLLVVCMLVYLFFSAEAVAFITFGMLLVWKYWAMYLCHKNASSSLGAKRWLMPRYRWLWKKNELFGTAITLQR